MSKVKEMLAKILSKYTELTTDKGVLTYDGELEMGKDVYLLNEDGEITDAADGEYTTEDGTVVVVADSKVAEIREKAAEPEAEIEAAEPVNEPEGEIADDVDIHNLAAEVNRLKDENEKKKEEIADLIKRVEALEGKSGETEEALRQMSAAKPAHEEIKSSERVSDIEKHLTPHQRFLSGIAASVKK